MGTAELSEHLTDPSFMEILAFLLCLGFSSASSPPPPHIIFILADDLGVNDVGWRNPNILTPNLDSLALNGVVLEQHYAQFQCTPSRAALMTSRYPYKYGRQRGVLRATQPTGLSLDNPLLPEYLQDVGYTTHLLGKWHLGFCHPSYLPTNRGFSSHYGFWNAEEDYWRAWLTCHAMGVCHSLASSQGFQISFPQARTWNRVEHQLLYLLGWSRLEKVVGTSAIRMSQTNFQNMGKIIFSKPILMNQKSNEGYLWPELQNVTDMADISFKNIGRLG